MPDDIDIFEKSNCIATKEDNYTVTFTGPLAGDDKCNITLKEEIGSDGNLYEVYQFVIGYDDLYRIEPYSQTFVNGSLEPSPLIGKHGAHFELECRIKRSGVIKKFPFVEGSREVVSLVDGVATKFKMARCTDDSCDEVDDNSVTDISPSSNDDPMVWFKVVLVII